MTTGFEGNDQHGEDKAVAFRWIKALCQTCNPKHVLDNGRVWALCGTRSVIHPKGFEEAEMAELITALPVIEGKAKRKKA